MSESDPILVTGATGKVGRHAVTELLERGVRVRAVSRRPEDADLPRDVEVVGADLSDPETYAGALGGVDAVLLVWPFFATDVAAAFVRQAERHVRRIVFLSAMGARDELGQPAMFHGEIERLIEASRLRWAFLRAGGFASNTLMWADQIRAGDVVRWPYGRAGRSLIHERDIAAVAAQTLTEPGHDFSTYTLTGPAVVTQAEQVRAIGDAIGKTLRWEELSRQEARERLLAAWGDPVFVEGALDHWARIADDPEPVTGTVREVTGRSPRTFAQWAAEHAGDFG